MSIANFKDFDGLKLPAEFNIIKERIDRLDVRNEDVWVTSYPKAGTTWCQELVWLIGNNLDYEGAQIDIDSRFPFLEFTAFSHEVKKFQEKYNISVNYNGNPPDYIKAFEETKGIRYIKTHLAWEFLPKQIKGLVKSPKIIHIMRNPKQVASSYYNHAANVFPFFVGSLEEFVDLYIKGNVLYGNYFRTVLSYWKQRYLPNLLILTYEEMHGDMTAVIRKVSNFLGKSYTEEEIGKLAIHLSFDKMQKNPAVNFQNIIKNKKIQFIRSGAIDSYRHELTAKMVDKLDHWVTENVKGTGLPYENC